MWHSFLIEWWATYVDKIVSTCFHPVINSFFFGLKKLLLQEISHRPSMSHGDVVLVSLILNMVIQGYKKTFYTKNHLNLWPQARFAEGEEGSVYGQHAKFCSFIEYKFIIAAIVAWIAVCIYFTFAHFSFRFAPFLIQLQRKDIKEKDFFYLSFYLRKTELWVEWQYGLGKPQKKGFFLRLPLHFGLGDVKNIID